MTPEEYAKAKGHHDSQGIRRCGNLGLCINTEERKESIMAWSEMDYIHTVQGIAREASVATANVWDAPLSAARDARFRREEQFAFNWGLDD